MNVRPAAGTDLLQIAKLHEAAFSGFFMTRLGRRFLTAYYALILEYGDGVVLVADGDDGRLWGFVSGFLDSPSFYRLLRARRWHFGALGLLGVMRDPLILGRLLRNQRRVSQRADRQRDRRHEVELSSLAVDPEVQGIGVGRALVMEFRAWALVRGGERIYLTTDAAANEGVNRFYRKLGFCPDGCVDAASSRPMNRYAMSLLSSQRVVDLGSARPPPGKHTLEIDGPLTVGLSGHEVSSRTPR